MRRYWSQTLTRRYLRPTLTMRYLWQYLKMGYLEAVKNSETVDENREALQIRESGSKDTEEELFTILRPR